MSLFHLAPFEQARGINTVRVKKHKCRNFYGSGEAFVS